MHRTASSLLAVHDPASCVHTEGLAATAVIRDEGTPRDKQQVLLRAAAPATRADGRGAGGAAMTATAGKLPRRSERAGRALAALLTLLAAASAAADGVQRLERPAGGWTHSGLKDEAGTVTYAYPANLIDRGGQRGRTLIEGRLQAIGLETRQPLLIVNGQPLPLQRDAEGRFARPYAFGPGPHGIELRDGQGRTVQRAQFYEANAAKTSARIRVILGWDDPRAELDLHVLTPDGQHAFWARPVLSNGGGLDVDSVDGAGPEMFSIAAPLPGAYHVYVNFWGRIGEGGYHFDDAARAQPLITARVTLVFDENTPRERRESFTVPMRRIGDLTHVRSFRRG